MRAAKRILSVSALVVACAVVSGCGTDQFLGADSGRRTTHGTNQVADHGTNQVADHGTNQVADHGTNQ
jgi:predicted small secreted protein